MALLGSQAPAFHIRNRPLLVKAPLDVLEAADAEVGEPLEGRRREVEVVCVAADAAVRDLDRDGVAVV